MSIKNKPRHPEGNGAGAEANIRKIPGGDTIFDVMESFDGYGQRDPQWINEQLEKSLIIPGVEIPRPDVVLHVGRGELTRGSISGGIGKEKGNKSTNAQIKSAAILCGGIDILRPGVGARRVLVGDTEQGSYWGSLSVDRIRRLTGGKGLDGLTYLDLRVYDPGDRLAIIAAAIERYTPDFVVIDGIRDLVNSVNDEEAANELVGKLMRWSVEYNCHIHCILHQNKGSQLANGWLGGALSKKSELVFEINKSKESDEIAIVTALLSRGLAPEPYGLRRDADGLPYIVDGTFLTSVASERKAKAVTPATIDDDLLRAVLSRVVPGNGMTRTPLIMGMQQELEWEGIKLGQTALRPFVDHCQEEGILRKEKPEGSKYPHYFLVKGQSC